MSAENQPIVYFPISQEEQAIQHRADFLLAQDVYEKVAMFLERGLNNVYNMKDPKDLDQHRAHGAILLHGPRGSGKSAILVNLPVYLQHKSPALFRDLLILKPIDPTLLENGENMFLDIFIAALVRNEEVKAKLGQCGCDVDDFYDQLNKTGSALESTQTQHEQHGIDRIRALIGGSKIADQVHALFDATLKLTGKKLIVFPIDDVDTSLQYAQEKLEIVRKYMISPYAIPLISGDLSLYEEVVWRNFYGRLTTDCTEEKSTALDRAKQLSLDYHRKILPLPRRIAVPDLYTYLDNKNLFLQDQGKNSLSFPQFKYWLEAVLNERVNGHENSFLPTPIKTLREFSQLISHVQNLLPALNEKLQKYNPQSSIEMRRLIFMKPAVAKEIQAFEKDYNKVISLETKELRNKARTEAYDSLATRIQAIPQDSETGLTSNANEFYRTLSNYFMHQEEGGAAYLIMQANLHLAYCAKHGSNIKLSIFDTDLFRPQNHHKYNQFKKIHKPRSEWADYLKSNLPVTWEKNIPENVILPYPLPETGILIQDINKPFSGQDIPKDKGSKEFLDDDAEIIRRLMCQYDFSSTVTRTTLIFTGRIFEFIMYSLTTDVTENKILEIMHKNPFYSASELLNAEYNTIYNADQSFNYSDSDDENHVLGDTLSKHVEEINTWRKKHALDECGAPHSLLIYHVFKLFFNQTYQYKALFESENKFVRMAKIALSSFHAIWAIFGSLEKGAVFGLDGVISNSPVTDPDKDFEQSPLYKQNILPFLKKNKSTSSNYFNFQTNSYTYALASHPLLKVFSDVYEATRKTYPNEPQETPEKRRLNKINSIINAEFRIFGKNKNDIANKPYSELRKWLDQLDLSLRKSGFDPHDVFSMGGRQEHKSGNSGLSKLHHVFYIMDQQRPAPTE